VFSRRVPGNLTPNRLTGTLEEFRRQGRTFIDLTLSNPTLASFDYPPHLLEALAAPAAHVYQPEPRGLRSARDAVAMDYSRRRIHVSPERVVLTASTSEAYSLLFKVFCDPGDEVLVPRPSYPLFEHLTRLDAVVTRPYELEFHGRWSADIARIERALTDRSRALLMVSPNNPTGSYVRQEELEAITALCRTTGMALIVDEVFAEYELTPGAIANSANVLERDEVLVFSLGGLSKSAGLPHVKLGWMAVTGPGDLVERALDRIDFAADAYLSVSTPVQHAASALIAGGALVRAQIQERILGNLDQLRTRVGKTPSCRVLPAEGGWSAVVQVPTLMPEEELVLALLMEDGVLVHPGYFFDFASESFLVVSLLPEPPLFLEGVSRVCGRFDRVA